ncbi:molybdenum cofactor guanylyltransferase [Nakamurella sp.]|uniref:molybdenum cofactor guanylyltransferase n=1 Tax=Nakamurella sp. TaxID=1869182 RepID=UPI00378420B8
MTNRPAAAIVLAGGGGRRLGGVDKPALRIGDRTLLEVALGAVDGVPTVLVGPARAVPAGVVVVREDPPGGGPAAAVAAGVAGLPGDLPPDAPVAVLAADLPALDVAAISRLCAALSSRSAGQHGAVLVDGQGRRQWLIGVWRLGPLAAAVRQRTDWHGASLRELLGPLHPTEVRGYEAAADDVDTPDDLRRLGEVDGDRL